jgi:hypothetical protein
MEELELYLRKKIDELNKMAVFDIATETLKIWLDDYEPALSQHDVIKSGCVHENIDVILPIKRCLKCQHIEEWKPKQTVL